MSEEQKHLDLSKVMQMAQEESSKGSGDGSSEEYKHKLIYPRQGTLKVKLLYNPKAELVTRSVDRHRVENVSITCLTTYNESCPLCEVINSVHNAMGNDNLLWRQKRITRGFSFAQYVDSDYSWGNDETPPLEGEVIFLMYPWSVFNQLNKIFNEAGNRIAELVATNEGLVVGINREGNDYRASVDVFRGKFKSCDSEEEFFAMINDLPNLYEQVAPVTPTDEIRTSIKDAADKLRKQYLSNRVDDVGQPGQYTSNAPINNNLGNTANQGQSNATAGYPSQSVPYHNNNSRDDDPNEAQGGSGGDGGGEGVPEVPECFKNYGSVDENKCLICPYQIQCMELSGDKSYNAFE